MSTKKICGFNWKNSSHIQWLMEYSQKSKIVFPHSMFNVSGVITAEEFTSWSKEINKNSEGREVWIKLTGAWSKKKNRGKKNSKQDTKIQLDDTVYRQLQFLAKGESIKETLKRLISGDYKEEQNLRKKKISDDNCTFKLIEISKLETRIIELEKQLSEEKELELKIKESTCQHNEFITQHKKEQPNKKKMTLVRRTKTILYLGKT